MVGVKMGAGGALRGDKADDPLGPAAAGGEVGRVGGNLLAEGAARGNNTLDDGNESAGSAGVATQAEERGQIAGKRAIPCAFPRHTGSSFPMRMGVACLILP